MDKQGNIFYEIPFLFPCPRFSLSRHTCARQLSSRKTSSSTVQDPAPTAISDLFWRQKCYCCSLRWQRSRIEAWANSSVQLVPLMSPRPPFCMRRGEPAAQLPPPAERVPPATRLLLERLSSWCKGDAETHLGGDGCCTTAPNRLPNQKYTSLKSSCWIKSCILKHFKACTGKRDLERDHQTAHMQLFKKHSPVLHWFCFASPPFSKSNNSLGFFKAFCNTLPFKCSHLLISKCNCSQIKVQKGA